MPHLITSISGIRGIPGETLLLQNIQAYVCAFAHFRETGPIVVGYDGRPTGIALKDITRAALIMGGRDVIDLGMVPTPTVQLMVERSNAAGGIAITASHNPSEWNGLKFIDHTGIFLDEQQNAELFQFAENIKPSYVLWNHFGDLTIDDSAVDRHIAAVLEYPYVNCKAIRSRKFRVVVDAVNASGSFAVPELLKRLDCKVITLCCEGNGIFPHTPEPLPQNLTALGIAVVDQNADLGIAVDPDADRLVIYTEKGEPFGEEYTITTAVDSVLSHKAYKSNKTVKSVVVNLSTSRAVDDIAKKYGATVYRTPVGEINVVKKMLEVGAVVGGEGSGGVIVPAIHAGRDSLVGILLALNAFAAFSGPISLYRHSLPGYVIRKFKYSTIDLRSETVIHRVVRRFHNERLDTGDGVRIDFETGWVHLRMSNTEPIMRVIAEARTNDEAELLADLVGTTAFGKDVKAIQ